MSWVEEVLARRDLWSRAPSPHNTQPWVVAAHDDRLVVGWDERRHLIKGDPTRRDLLLSLGCVVEALTIVADHLGHSLHVSWDVDVDARHAATLSLRRRSPAQPSSDHRAFAGIAGSADALDALSPEVLLARRTARSAFRKRLSEGDVDQLAADAHLPDEVGLQIVPAAWVDRWLPVADEWALFGPAAGELASWLRLFPRHPRYDQDGLTDKTLELSRLETIGLRVALRRPARRVLHRLRVTRLVAAQATAKPVGTVVALMAPSGLELDDIGALGRTLMRTWLHTNHRGWSAHPLSALLDCPESANAWGSGPAWSSEREVPDRAPYAVLRLGVPEQPAPPSARL